MKRFLSATLAMALVGGWLVPSSAEAGPLQRLFWRLRGGTSDTAVRTAPVESDGYRRYSYEPSMDGTVAPRSSTSRSRSATKPPWMYPKADPRRYQMHN